MTDDRQRTEVRLLFRKEEINIENREDAGVVQVTYAGALGKVSDECDVEITGEDLLIAFNHRYLHEALRAIKDEKIIIKLESAVKSLVILPYDAEIKAHSPDGIIISSGPGNPEDSPELIANIREIIKLGVPMFAVGLGHQLLALAHGFKTRRLKYGHRGANQPVKHLADGRVYITNQNHGYTVAPDSIDNSVARVLFENVTDKTCEGLEYTGKPMFSTEFYPEATWNSERNTSFLFDKFINSLTIV
jgi:carbamoyl-phosphate synthase small subunit